MQFLQAFSPEEYQRVFCTHVGLARAEQPDGSVLWSAPGAGSIHFFGSLGAINSGLGDYVVPEDALASLDYEFSFLHFGVVHQGVTYEMIDGQAVLQERPCTFVSFDESPVGVYHWRAGQRFRGTEVSIDTRYLESTLLPVLGLTLDDLAFLRGGNRCPLLTEELQAVLERFEAAMRAGRLTPALQTALALEFVALLARPDVQAALKDGTDTHAETCAVKVGDRMLTLNPDDLLRIERARQLLARDAARFPTTQHLAREVGLSEQKLKVGFAHQYQQTVWDYANSVRMSEAVRLLRDTGASVAEVSQAVGYQSQAAFTSMFKRWSGLTPRQFRTQAFVR